MKDRADPEVSRSEGRLPDSYLGTKRVSEEKLEKRRAGGRCLRMVKEPLAFVSIAKKFTSSSESRSSISAYGSAPNANDGSKIRHDRSLETAFLFFIIYLSTSPWRVGFYGKNLL
jgi:hypothetical protein